MSLSDLHTIPSIKCRCNFLFPALRPRLQDSVAANSTEGFGCAVAAFESLGAQEVLIEELPAALRSLLVKEWAALWAQTPTGAAEETEEGHLPNDQDPEGPHSRMQYHTSTRCVSEPEALIAYAERWTSAVEQAGQRGAQGDRSER